MKLPFVPLSASGCRWRSPVLHPLASRVGRDGSPAASAASFAADTGDSLIPIAETEAPNAQSGNSSLHSSPVLCRTLEDRHYRPTTQHSPRCCAPCLADRLVSSGTGPAPLHYRSLCRVCILDYGLRGFFRWSAIAATPEALCSCGALWLACARCDGKRFCDCA